MPTYVYEYLTKAGKPTGKTVEVFQHMREEALTVHKGKPVRKCVVLNRPRVPAHDLHGTREVCHDIQAQPHEVPKLRQLYAPYGVAHCWQEDGSVRFKTRSEAKKFFAADKALRLKFQHQKEDGIELRTPAQKAARQRRFDKITEKSETLKASTPNPLLR